MVHSVLLEIVLVLAASVVVAAVLRRVSAPPVVGFIIAGILIGPGGFRLVTEYEQIEVLAEVGVILLLFTVGMKLSLRDLWVLRGTVFGGGGLQVVGTAAITAAAVVTVTGATPAVAVTWGFLVALSSTALVLWLLEDAGELGSARGRVSVGVLLFQDLAVIPVLLALPLLAGVAAEPSSALVIAGRSIVVLVVTVVVGRFVFPLVTARVVATGSRELFTLTTVLVAVGTAVFVGSFGVSVALGAFLAGIVISESEFVSRIAADITPLRDIFNSLFFVSMGMLVDTSLWLERPLLMVGLVAAVILGKAVIAGFVGFVALRSVAGAVMVGVGLAQIGEFSFVVAHQAQRLGLLGPSDHRLFLSVAVPTMLLTPLLLAAGRRLVARRSKVRPDSRGASPPAPTDHVVIIGYGVNGENVSRMLTRIGVPFLVVDLNPHTVRTLTDAGAPAICGDARRDEVLAKAGIAQARVLISAIPDAASTREVVAAARAANSAITIVARTRYVREVEPLYELGADLVIPEEFETSLELMGRVLALYGAPRHLVEREKSALRNDHYGALRGLEAHAERPSLEELLGHPELIEVGVPTGSSADGESLRDLDLRRRTGATVVAVRRGDDVTANPDPGFTLAGGDLLVLLGTAAAATEVRALVEGSSS
jgi:CPA2 family monovalent cation:H+ antiporter-2